MIYLLVSAILFAVASLLCKERNACLIVAFVASSTLIMQESMSWDGSALYWLRAIVTTCGAVALCFVRTQFGFYQASIYAMTVVVYALLAYDVASYNQWLDAGGIGGMPIAIVWGDTYRSLTHGLVICQFVGFLPVIWSAAVSMWASGDNSSANLLRGKRGFKQ